jgi:hypothetical protein
MSRYPVNTKPRDTTAVIDANPVRDAAGPFTSFRCAFTEAARKRSSRRD